MASQAIAPVATRRITALSEKICETSYSVHGLYADLVEDAALNPDTMDERRGGWGRLLALFALSTRATSPFRPGARRHTVRSRPVSVSGRARRPRRCSAGTEAASNQLWNAIPSGSTATKRGWFSVN